MNFREKAEMLTLYPKRLLATWVDLTMPRRNWKLYDAPAKDRVNVAKMKIERARRACRVNSKNFTLSDAGLRSR